MDVVGVSTFNDNVKLLDNDVLQIGTGQDLSIWHDASDTQIKNTTGELQIRGDTVVLAASTAYEKYIKGTYNGSVEIYYDNAKKLETTSTGINVTGTHVDDGALHDGDVTFTGASHNGYWEKSNSRFKLSDGGKVVFGDSADLQIYHTSSWNYIQGSTSGVNLAIQAKSGENSVIAIPDGKTSLYYDGNEKILTTSSGVEVTGALNLTGASSGNYINVGSSTVYANAAINIHRNGNGYADMRLASNYGAKVALAGASNNTDEFFIQQDNQKDAYIYNEAAKDIIFGTSNTARLRITSAGKVGISEASPQALLHLNDGANSTIMFGNTTHGYKIRANVSSSNDYGLLIEDEDGVDLYRAVSSTGTSNTNTHTWWTAGTERLRIDSNGVLTTKQSSTNTNSGNWNGAAFGIQNTHDTDNNASVIWFRNSAEGCDSAIQGIHEDAAGTGGSRRGHIQFGTSGANSSGSVVERLRITSEGQIRKAQGANVTSLKTYNSNADAFWLDHYQYQVSSTYQRYRDIVSIGDGTWGSNIRFFTNQNGSQNGIERLRIMSTGELLQYGFTGSADTSADDLVLGNTTGGVNRGITIWSNSSQNGSIAFADNDSNFRGAVQYLHNDDEMRFVVTGEERYRITQHATFVNPTTSGDSVNTKAGAKWYTLSGATPLDGTNTNQTYTPLMRCGHSFNGTMYIWMVFNGSEFHNGCRQQVIDCQGTYGYVSMEDESVHYQNALGAGLNSMDFAYQNSGGGGYPNYYFKVRGTWASGQNTPYILWTWVGQNSEYPYAL